MHEFNNIKKYIDYFHDGNLYDIQIADNHIKFYIESAEIDPDDIKEESILNERYRIKGIPWLKGVIQVVINNQIPKRLIHIISEDGEIKDLEIHDNKVLLNVMWSKYSDLDFRDFTCNEISCDKAVFYIEEDAK
ncbi:MAG: hypothetical protein ACOYK9_01525 [Chlamydiia bacterium]